MFSSLQTLADSYKHGRHNARPESQVILRNTWDAFGKALENFSIASSGVEDKQYYLNTLWLRHARNAEGRAGYDLVQTEDGIEISEQGSVGVECILQQENGRFFLRNSRNKNIPLATIPIIVSRLVEEILEPKNTLPTVLYKCPERSPGYVAK